MTDETNRKVELSKDVLAPADGPRDELISTAIKFLQNPKVQQSPVSQRKAFLERKGLTKEEIELAIERSGVPSDKPTQVYPPQPPGIQAPIPGAVVPYQQSAPPVGTLVKIRDVLHTIALIGGLSYAAYKFFKEYFLPWILGKPKTEDRLDKIENMVIELQKNIVETLSKIQLTLTSMQETMSTNQEKVQAISHEVYSQRSSTAMSNINESQFATEMKSELQTVKGLLLNRRQFPPTPSSSSLPAWQLSQTATPTSKSNMVKPSGDATPVSEPSGDVSIVSEPSGDAIVSEEAYLNQNKNDRTDAENNEEVKVNFSLEETTNVDMSDVSQPIKTEASDILNQSEDTEDNLQMKSKGENDNEEEVKVNFSLEETTNVDMSDVSQPIKTEASDILNQSEDTEDNLQMKSNGENDNEEEVD